MRHQPPHLSVMVLLKEGMAWTALMACRRGLNWRGQGGRPYLHSILGREMPQWLGADLAWSKTPTWTWLTGALFRVSSGEYVSSFEF